MLTQPKLSINERAMLIYLRVHMWSADQLSDKLSEKLCNDEGVEQDAVSVIIHTLPKAALDPIRTARNRVRALWLKASLPYMDGGIRIIPIGKLEKFKTEVDAAITDYNNVVKGFLEIDYPRLCEQHAERIKKLLQGQAMPSSKELSYRFQVSIRYIPLPRREDIRYGSISADTNTALISQFDSGQNELLRQSMLTIWRLMAKMLGKISETLSNTNKVFRDSLIDNLKAFCVDIPLLNLTDDKELEDTRNAVMNSIASLDADDLRDNVIMRKSVAKKAQALLEGVNRKINLELE